MLLNVATSRRPGVIGSTLRRTLALALLLAPAMYAQSAQSYAAQLSALFTTIEAGNTNVSGAGVELQQRFSRLYATERFGALSIGIGGQYTVHTKVRDKLTITGLFVEPRWVPATGTNRIFPYLSARLAVQRMRGVFQFAAGGSSTGSAFGGGGGVAVKLTRQINLDAGAQLVRQQFGTIGVVTFRPLTTYTAKVGISLGYPR